MAPHRETRVDEREPHTIDILIDAAENPNIFSRVLRNWLLRHTKWRDARSRFFSAFANQDIYTADRLIAAANAFDIIPSSAFPRRVTVSENLESARDASRKLFLALPTGPERNSVLSILGRIGKSTLKQKIRHRAQVVTDKIGDRLPDLAQVTDEAVNCRNHYVHGSKGSFDYNTNLPLFFFLIGTLEFVFAASDLIDAGWNPVKWLKRGSTLAHPFSQYMYGYKENLRILKRNLK